MAAEPRHPKPFFCSGTNRFGRPCTNRVEHDGDECGRCRGVAGLPAFDAPPKTAPLVPALPAPDDWTVASQLQARLAPLAAGNQQLERLVQVCGQLAGNSRASGSKVVYEQHWRTFVLFCESVGLSAELPVPAETVACFVAYLAEFGRVDRETGERDGTGAPLRHGYLRQAISAIGYRHDLHGLPSPVNDPLVRGVLRGYGRMHGTDVRGKDPIRLDGLTRIATTLSTVPRMAQRDRALMLLATDPRLGLNAGQLARLDGEHVLLGANAHEPAALLVHPGGRSLHLEPVELDPDTEVPAGCAIRALLDLAPDAFGPVFRSAARQRLSRQGVMKIVRAAVAVAGLTDIAIADGLPRLAAAQDRARLANNVGQPDLADVRDLALILNLYWGAFRGSELVAMTWSDTRVVDRGVEWRVRQAKNDQLGKGEIVGAARNPNSLLCPAAALAEWRFACADLLGRELCDDDPVFIRLDRQLDDLEPMTRDGAAQIVKRAAVAAGLNGNYASHSPRAGFVTDALDAGATREQVRATAAGPTSAASIPTTARPRSGAATTPRSASLEHEDLPRRLLPRPGRPRTGAGVRRFAPRGGAGGDRQPDRPAEPAQRRIASPAVPAQLPDRGRASRAALPLRPEPLPSPLPALRAAHRPSPHLRQAVGEAAGARGPDRSRPLGRLQGAHGRRTTNATACCRPRCSLSGLAIVLTSSEMPANVSPIGTSTQDARSARRRTSRRYRDAEDRLEPFEQLARVVIMRRGHLGLSQQELAERMGTTASVISRIEGGQHRCSTETLRRLAEALGGHAVVGFDFGTTRVPDQQLVRL